MNIPYYAAPGLLRQKDVDEMITKSRREKPKVPVLSKTNDIIISQDKSKVIHDAIFDFFGVTVQQMATETREREICFPRQISMYLHRQITNYSLKKVGNMYGGRDHTTTINAVAVIKDILKQEHDTAEYRTLITFLNSYGFE